MSVVSSLFRRWVRPTHLSRLLSGALVLVGAAGAQAAEPVGSLRALLELDEPVATVSAADALDSERALGQGVSLGDTSTGHLASAVTLPREGEHIALAESHRDRDNHYAAQDLALILADVAAAMHTRDDAPRLLMGDASSAQGGDLRGHASHNSGRDIDLLFYVRNAAGESVEPPRFVKFRNGLKSKDGSWSFDLERNWAFVQALLEHETVQTQYIFIYDPLKQALLEYATEHEVDAGLIARAASVLHQPSDSAPHDDHYHVRVFCSARDRLEGCENRGPSWGWADLHDDVVGRRATALLRAAQMDPSLAGAALDRLVAMRVRGASPALAAMLPDAAPQERQPLREALWAIGVDRASLPALTAALPGESDPEARRSLLGLIAATDDPDAIAFLATAAREAPETREATRAVEVLARIEHPLAVGALVDLIDHPDERVRTDVVAALQSLTNHAGPEATTVEALHDGWRAWWQAHRHEDRASWLRAGFAEVGIEMTSIVDTSAVEALIAAQTEQAAFVSDNAHRVLMHALGYWFSRATPAAERRERWTSWWSRNAWRFESPR